MPVSSWATTVPPTIHLVDSKQPIPCHTNMTVYVSVSGIRHTHNETLYVTDDDGKQHDIIGEAYVCRLCGQIYIEPGRKLSHLVGKVAHVWREPNTQNIAKTHVNHNKGNCECGAWASGAALQSSTHSRWCAEFSMHKPQELSEVEKCKQSAKLTVNKILVAQLIRYMGLNKVISGKP